MLALAPVADADRVLIVENAASPVSVSISKAYAAKRGVKNILRIQCADSAKSAANETIDFPAFHEKIEVPLLAALKAKPNTDFIVLTKGVPIRISNADTGMSGKQPSLDSYIASIDYRQRKDVQRITLNDSGFTGKCWANRFWNSTERFSHAKFGGYLVTRL